MLFLLFFFFWIVDIIEYNKIDVILWILLCGYCIKGIVMYWMYWGYVIMIVFYGFCNVDIYCLVVF